MTGYEHAVIHRWYTLGRPTGPASERIDSVSDRVRYEVPRCRGAGPARGRVARFGMLDGGR